MFEAQGPVLRVVGDEVQATSGGRRQAFAKAQRADSDLVVDLAALHFADASLMHDLANLARRLRARGRRLLLSRPQPQIQRLIETVGLVRLPSVALAPAG